MKEMVFLVIHLRLVFFSKELIESIEQNHFDPVNYLYWRNKDLEFNSIKSLLSSLNQRVQTLF